jgi:hypothetical protein
VAGDRREKAVSLLRGTKDAELWENVVKNARDAEMVDGGVWEDGATTRSEAGDNLTGGHMASCSIPLHYITSQGSPDLVPLPSACAARAASFQLSTHPRFSIKNLSSLHGAKRAKAFF